MIYLASPYSHPDPAVREERFREACRAAAKLISLGRIVSRPSPTVTRLPFTDCQSTGGFGNGSIDGSWSVVTKWLC